MTPPALWRRYATGIVWNVAGAVFNQGSTFALGVIVANVLGRERYGVYGFLQSTILLFMNIGQLAMGFVSTKFVAEYRTAQKERAGRVIVACLALAAVSGALASLIAFAAAPFIADRVLHDRSAATLIRLGAPAIFFMIFNVPCMGILAGFENFRKNAFGGVLAGIVYVGICTAMVMRFALPGVVAGISISMGFQAVLLFFLVLHEARRQGVAVRWSSVREIGLERTNLLHVAVPAALTGFTTLPAIWLGSAILARQEGGITQLALFTAANTIRQLVMFVPQLVNGVGFSILASYRGIEDGKGYRRAFWMNVIAVGGIAVCAAAVVLLAGPYILRIYGKSFAEGYPALMVLIACTIPESLALAAYQVIQTQGRIWMSLLVVAIPRDLLYVVCAWLLTRTYGAVGLAFATLIALLLFLFTNIVLVRRLGIRTHA